MANKKKKIPAARAAMIGKWQSDHGMQSRDERRLAGKPSSGYGITEDDPRWNKRLQGNKK